MIPWRDHQSASVSSPPGRAGQSRAKLLATCYDSQLDKPRLFLAVTDTVHVNILGIDNCKCVMHMCVFMYFVGNKVITTTTTTTTTTLFNVSTIARPGPLLLSEIS